MANPLPPMPDLSETDYRKLTSKSLIRSVDMSLEMSSECMEVITMAVDKHQNTKNYEVSSFCFILFVFSIHEFVLMYKFILHLVLFQFS